MRGKTSTSALTRSGDAHRAGERWRYKAGPEAFFTCVLQASQHLTPDEAAELEAWEVSYRDVGLSCGTSDWPGWAGKVFGWEDWQADLDDGGRRLTTPGRPAIPANGYHLYRLWGPERRLLYVGVSVRLQERISSHVRRWGDLIEDVTWEEHTDERSMLAAESEAIRNEDPAFNKRGIR